MTSLDLGRAAAGSPQASLSDLEAVAEQFVRQLEIAEKDNGLRAYLTGSSPKLKVLAGEVVFSTSSFSDYLARVGNTELSREAFRIVLEAPAAQDDRYTRMGAVLNHLVEATTAVRDATASLNSRLRNEIQYIRSNERSIRLYAGANPNLEYEALAATPSIHVKLQTRK